MAEVKLGKLPGQSKPIEVKTIVESAEMQKAPMGKRLFHAFFMVDSPKQILDNLLFKVTVPSIKQLMENLFNRGIHMLFFGEDSLGVPSQTVNSNQSFVSYGSFFSGSNHGNTAEQALKVRTLADFDMPIIAPTAENPDAEKQANLVIAQMRELIGVRAPNGYAKVSELYQSVGRTPEFTDEYYGWYDLSAAKAVPLGDGRYLVQMPKAVMLR